MPAQAACCLFPPILDVLGLRIAGRYVQAGEKNGAPWFRRLDGKVLLELGPLRGDAPGMRRWVFSIESPESGSGRFASSVMTASYCNERCPPQWVRDWVEHGLALDVTHKRDRGVSVTISVPDQEIRALIHSFDGLREAPGEVERAAQARLAVELNDLAEGEAAGRRALTDEAYGAFLEIALAQERERAKLVVQQVEMSAPLKVPLQVHGRPPVTGGLGAQLPGQREWRIDSALELAPLQEGAAALGSAPPPALEMQLPSCKQLAPAAQPPLQQLMLLLRALMSFVSKRKGSGQDASALTGHMRALRLLLGGLRQLLGGSLDLPDAVYGSLASYTSSAHSSSSPRSYGAPFFEAAGLSVGSLRAQLEQCGPARIRALLAFLPAALRAQRIPRSLQDPTEKKKHKISRRTQARRYNRAEMCRRYTAAEAARESPGEVERAAQARLAGELNGLAEGEAAGRRALTDEAYGAFLEIAQEYKETRRQLEACRRIQPVWRGYAARRDGGPIWHRRRAVEARKAEAGRRAILHECSTAALTIQRMARGRRGRRDAQMRRMQIYRDRFLQAQRAEEDTRRRAAALRKQEHLLAAEECDERSAVENEANAAFAELLSGRTEPRQQLAEAAEGGAELRGHAVQSMCPSADLKEEPRCIFTEMSLPPTEREAAETDAERQRWLAPAASRGAAGQGTQQRVPERDAAPAAAECPDIHLSARPAEVTEMAEAPRGSAAEQVKCPLREVSQHTKRHRGGRRRSGATPQLGAGPAAQQAAESALGPIPEGSPLRHRSPAPPSRTKTRGQRHKKPCDDPESCFREMVEVSCGLSEKLRRADTDTWRFEKKGPPFTLNLFLSGGLGLSPEELRLIGVIWHSMFLVEGSFKALAEPNAEAADRPAPPESPAPRAAAPATPIKVSAIPTEGFSEAAESPATPVGASAPPIKDFTEPDAEAARPPATPSDAPATTPAEEPTSPTRSVARLSAGSRREVEAWAPPACVSANGEYLEEWDGNEPEGVAMTEEQLDAHLRSIGLA